MNFGLQLERLPYMVQGVWSENLEQQVEATTQFRKLLSIGKLRSLACRLCVVLIEAGGHVHRYIAERNPPIEEVISQGVIPRFVQFLQRQDAPHLQVKLFPVHLISPASLMCLNL